MRPTGRSRILTQALGVPCGSASRLVTKPGCGPGYYRVQGERRWDYLAPAIRGRVRLGIWLVGGYLAWLHPCVFANEVLDTMTGALA